MTTVLVVDDTPDMAILMKRACQDQGHEVLIAEDGPSALDIAAREMPDTILLDIMMPRMSGIEVLQRLKSDADTRAIPVILVTAKGEDGDVIAGLNEGAHDYVAKPFNRGVLAARVGAAVGIKKDHDRLKRLNKQLRDEITERERIQDELVQARRLEAIGHLSAGIAHEINTPTQYVGDNTRFLQEAFDDLLELFDRYEVLREEAKQQGLEETVASVEAVSQKVDAEYLFHEIPKAIAQSLEGLERVSTIVRSMKEFAHPSVCEKHAVDLNAMIRNTLTLSSNEWKYVAELNTDLSPDLPDVACVPGDVNQAVLNLIVNAAQAIADDLKRRKVTGKGALTVRTRPYERWVEIQIEDTGGGIPENIRDKIFDPFYTTKEVGRGTGQGLAIVHSIVVTKHGGTISFNTEVGKGTTFFVRLPVSDTPGNVEVKAPELAACPA